jgi:hypothetical protein
VTDPTDPTDLLPEIGPELGSLVDLTHELGDPEVGLEAIRLELVHALFQRTQAARDFLLTGDQAGARAALDRPVWMEVWHDAVTKTAARVMAVTTSRLERAARRSGFPARRLKELLPTADDRAVLRAKLEAAGIPLEEAFSREASGASWWDLIRRRASRLEESWDRLENVVRLELASVDERRGAIESWRPSRVIPMAGAVTLVLVLAWVGLAIGGYLPRPRWLDSVADWFWSLPWP